MAVATRYVDEETVAGYCLVNEPTPPGPNYNSTWETLALRLIDAIQAVDTNHLIFYMALSSALFSDTLNRSNIVYEVHFYAPLSFTHSSGSAPAYPGNNEDWNDDIVYWDKAELKTRVEETYSYNWANNNNVPYFIGEWVTKNSYTGAETYTTHVAEIMNELSISHTHYTWKHGHGADGWGVYPSQGLTAKDADIETAFQVSLGNVIQPS